MIKIEKKIISLACGLSLSLIASSVYASYDCSYGYYVQVTSSNPTKIDPSSEITAEIVRTTPPPSTTIQSFSPGTYGSYMNNGMFGDAAQFNGNTGVLRLTFSYTTPNPVAPQMFEAPLDLKNYCGNGLAQTFIFPKDFKQLP